MREKTLPQKVAEYMDFECDDTLVMAVEGACITTPEWLADPDACVHRVRGAMEEMDEPDFA